MRVGHITDLLFCPAVSLSPSPTLSSPSWTSLSLPLCMAILCTPANLPHIQIFPIFGLKMIITLNLKCIKISVLKIWTKHLIHSCLNINENMNYLRFSLAESALRIAGESTPTFKIVEQNTRVFQCPSAFWRIHRGFPWILNSVRTLFVPNSKKKIVSLSGVPRKSPPYR